MSDNEWKKYRDQARKAGKDTNLWLLFDTSHEPTIGELVTATIDAAHSDERIGALLNKIVSWALDWGGVFHRETDWGTARLVRREGASERNKGRVIKVTAVATRWSGTSKGKENQEVAAGHPVMAVRKVLGSSDSDRAIQIVVSTPFLLSSIPGTSASQAVDLCTRVALRLSVQHARTALSRLSALVNARPIRASGDFSLKSSPMIDLADVAAESLLLVNELIEHGGKSDNSELLAALLNPFRRAARVASAYGSSGFTHSLTHEHEPFQDGSNEICITVEPSNERLEIVATTLSPLPGGDRVETKTVLFLTPKAIRRLRWTLLGLFKREQGSKPDEIEREPGNSGDSLVAASTYFLDEISAYVNDPGPSSRAPFDGRNKEDIRDQWADLSKAAVKEVRDATSVSYDGASNGRLVLNLQGSFIDECAPELSVIVELPSVVHESQINLRLAGMVEYANFKAAADHWKMLREGLKK